MAVAATATAEAEQVTETEISPRADSEDSRRAVSATNIVAQRNAEVTAAAKAATTEATEDSINMDHE